MRERVIRIAEYSAWKMAVKLLTISGTCFLFWVLAPALFNHQGDRYPPEIVRFLAILGVIVLFLYVFSIFLAILRASLSKPAVYFEGNSVVFSVFFSRKIELSNIESVYAGNKVSLLGDKIIISLVSGKFFTFNSTVIKESATALSDRINSNLPNRN